MSLETVRCEGTALEANVEEISVGSFSENEEELNLYSVQQIDDRQKKWSMMSKRYFNRSVLYHLKIWKDARLKKYFEVDSEGEWRK